MDYQRLKDFITLADNLSYKKAAELLQISPSTLSSRILALESELGQQLFTHQKRHVELTNAGVLFLKDAKELWQEYTLTFSRLHETQEAIFNTLSIAITGNGMPPRVEAALTLLCRQFPTLSLAISDDSMHQIIQSIQDGTIDVYFCYLNPSKRVKGIQYHSLYATPLCALLPRTHQLAHKNMISLKDLENESFFLYPRLADSSMHDLELSLLSESGIHFHIKESASAKNFYQITVGSGLGVALCPWVLRDHIPSTVVAIPLTDPITFTMYMLYSSTNKSPLVHTFLNIIRRMEF